MFKFKEYHFRYYNVRLVLFVIVLAAAGVLFIKSATAGTSSSAVNKQIMGIAMGMVCMLVISVMDYHWVLKLGWLWYLVNIGLLTAVRLFGVSGGWGAKRWIALPGLGTIQPSELTKIILILFFAMFFSRFSEKINSVFVLLAAMILFAVPVFMIFKQPDLSTTLVICVIILVMLYAAKLSYKWIFGTIGALIPVVVWFIYTIQQEGQTLLEEYQVNRVMSWINPGKFSADVTRQTNYSVMAIGSGQLRGKGLFNTTLLSVKNGNFLSEEDTDFIFAVIGEETGFIGSMIVIGLLFLVVAECVYVGIRARDLEGRLICVGVATLVAFQSFVNIGVATGLLPNTGLPLPFLSAGLSSLMSLFIGMGFVLSVSLQRKYEKI